MFLNLRESIYRLKDAQARAWDGIEPTEEEASGEAGHQMVTDSEPQAQTLSTSWGTE